MSACLGICGNVLASNLRYMVNCEKFFFLKKIDGKLQSIFEASMIYIRSGKGLQVSNLALCPKIRQRGRRRELICPRVLGMGGVTIGVAGGGGCGLAVWLPQSCDTNKIIINLNPFPTTRNFSLSYCVYTYNPYAAAKKSGIFVPNSGCSVLFTQEWWLGKPLSVLRCYLCLGERYPPHCRWRTC